jgi:hypothetical protein
MAATVINYTLVQSTIPGPPAQYQVQATINTSPNTGTSLFTYRFSDGLYDHVSTTVDLMTYPTAANPSFPFYRQSTVSFLSQNATEAIDFSAMVESRLTSLAKEYDAVATTFVPGTYPIVVP